jgi:hypothetical protein
MELVTLGDKHSLRVFFMYKQKEDPDIPTNLRTYDDIRRCKEKPNASRQESTRPASVPWAAGTLSRTVCLKGIGRQTDKFCWQILERLPK